MNKTFVIIVVIIILIAGWYFLSPLFFDEVVNEDFPIPTEKEMAEMSREELADLEKEIIENMEDSPVEENMPETESTLLSSGNFVNADSFHKGSGEAKIYQLADNSKVLRFEDFSVTNGPDLYVYLVSHSNPENRDDIHSGEYLELAKLKGNIGNQNYELPDNINLDDYKSVVIYCKPFHVIFSTASLK